MKTYEIYIPPFYLEMTEKDFETNYLLKNLKEIKIDKGNGNKTVKIKEILDKKILGYKTNRKFKKKISINKTNKTKRVEIICQCHQRFSLTRKAFGHKPYCHKKSNQEDCYFIFKLFDEKDNKNNEKNLDTFIIKEQGNNEIEDIHLNKKEESKEEKLKSELEEELEIEKNKNEKLETELLKRKRINEKIREAYSEEIIKRKK